MILKICTLNIHY